MDINKIELPPYVIASLYRNSLVEPIGNLPEKPAGKNKQLLVLVNHPAHQLLPDHELLFLEGILKACKLTTDDCNLVNMAHHTGKTYKEFYSELKPSTVFLFGTDPSLISLPVNFPHFQPQAFSSVTYLFSPPLQAFENDKILKSKLWVCLKRIFAI